MATKRRKRRESFGAIRQLPSKRYQASYVGPDGNRYTAPLTFTALEDARQWLARQRVAIADETWTAHDAVASVTAKKGKTTTFADYAEQWVSTRTNRHGEHLRPRTAAEYRRLINGPLRQFAERRLASIAPEDVREWYSDLVKTGTKTQAARAYELFKAIMTTATTDGRIKSNPVSIKGAASASTGRKVEPPSPAELASIVDRISPQYKAAVILAAWAGIRYGELTELRRKDLDRVGDVFIVNVSRAVTQVTGQGFVVGPTKSEAGVRAIALPPHVNGILEDHLRDYVNPFPESLLFSAADGHTHLAQSAFYKHWDPVRRAAGRGDMPWHALRHYGATRAALAGATLKELQARLGHSTVAAAMRYQHTAGRDEELARRMSELA